MRHTLLMLNYLIFSEVFWIYNLLNWRSIVMLSTYDSPYTCIVVSLSKTWLDLMFTQFVDFFSLDMPAKYYFLRLFCIECLKMQNFKGIFVLPTVRNPISDKGCQFKLPRLFWISILVMPTHMAFNWRAGCPYVWQEDPSYVLTPGGVIIKHRMI